MGHSVGTCWSQQIAAALPERVRGAILFASMADPRHDEADFALRKAVGYYPLKDCWCCGGTMDCCCHPFKGICGCLPRMIMKSMTGAGGGKGGVYNHEAKHGGAGLVEKFKADPFWYAAAVDT